MIDPYLNLSARQRTSASGKGVCYTCPPAVPSILEIVLRGRNGVRLVGGAIPRPETADGRQIEPLTSTVPCLEDMTAPAILAYRYYTKH